jgi:hypothetical protein
MEATKGDEPERESVAKSIDNDKTEKPAPATRTAPGSGNSRMKSALEVYAQQQATLMERLASISSSLKV